MSRDTPTDIAFTGERFVPGKASVTIEEDHLARYRFAAGFVKGKRVLDIACGTGYGSSMLAQAGAKSVVGVDISPEAVNFGATRYAHDNLAYETGSIYDYKGEDPFDIITSFETIEHVDDYLAALENLKKLLAPQGWLIISSPNRLITSPHCRSMDDPPGGYHVREFTIQELKTAMVSRGFRISDDNVYGQRLQPYPPTRLLRKVYDIFAKPKKRSSPEVTSLNGRMPRYFIFIAETRKEIQ